MAIKKETGMMGTKGQVCDCSHHSVFGWIVLIIGILFLIRDLGGWDFWGIQWWTVLFVIIGIKGIFRCKCCHRAF